MKDGGSAFPYSTIDGFTEAGMTLRDWFAGQALTALINTKFGADKAGAMDGNIVVQAAYDFADAILEVRDERPS